MNGLIIDIHDVLVDTRGVRAQAWREACASFGFEVSLDSVREQIVLPAHATLINTIGIGLNSGDGMKIYERYLDLLSKRFISRVISPLGTDRFLAILKNVATVRQVGLISEDPANHLIRYLRASNAEFLFQELPDEEKSSGRHSHRNALHSALERMNMSAQSSVLITANSARATAAVQLNLNVAIVSPNRISQVSSSGAVKQYRSTQELGELFYDDIAPLLVQ